MLLIKSNLKRVSILITILIALSLLVIFILTVQKKQTYQTYTLDYNQLKKFKYQIDSRDPKVVYQEVKNNIKNLSFTTKHDIIHLFGKALYQTKGATGVSICDDSFAFGCFHGLFIEAMTKEGIAIMTKLDKICQETGENNYDLCQHGIGHGLVEYFGREKLPQALEQCKLIQQNLLLGCSSGVFMDYFYPSEFGQSKSSSLKVDPDNPFKVCKFLDPEFINSCIFELPGLWRKTEPDISKLATRCFSLPDTVNQMYCFRGLGYATGDTRQPNPKLSLYMCNMISSEKERLYCLSGASWFYNSTDQSEDIVRLAKTLCKGSYNEQECQKLGNLFLDKSNNII